MDGRLRDHQVGFRRDRSSTDQIATLRIIVEQSLEWNSSLNVNFVDFLKAFDSLHRDTLWQLWDPSQIDTYHQGVLRGNGLSGCS